MVYLIAKRSDRDGCIAYKTQPGKRNVELRNYFHSLNLRGLEICTISRPMAYHEYEPYSFVNTEEEFIEKALNLMK